MSVCVDSKDFPLVSIITVTFNAEKYLENTIQSILNQTYNGVEYIIIDGKSTDNTLEIIREYSDSIDYWVSEKDDGIYDAMNKGISRSNGDIIGIVNSDDCLESSAIEKVVAAWVGSEPCIIHGNLAIYKGSGDFVEIRRPRVGRYSYLFSTPFKHPAMFVCSDIYKHVGVYDNKVGLAADYDFMLRARRYKVQSIYIDSVLSNVKLVGISTGGVRNAKYSELFKIIWKNSDSFFLASLGVLGRLLVKMRASLRAMGK